MDPTRRERVRWSGGEMAVTIAGDPARPAVVLLHGFPASARSFRHVIPGLAEVAYVVAPDLPGHGESDPVANPSFASFTAAVAEVLDRLRVGRRFLYVHDFGAPVALELAMQAPDLVAGLIIQNANAHRAGFGPGWEATLAYWADPTPERAEAATTHLTFEGTRDQYTAGVPAEVSARIVGEPWVEDWRVMAQPGRLELQRALVRDYAHHAARFEVIGEYLRHRQPPALLLWGRHDVFFDLAETLAWMQDLPRMEGHVFDAGHFLLETHAEPALALMREFVAGG